MSNNKQQVQYLKLDEITMGVNPRTTIKKDRIKEYARSIAAYGVLIPLVVTKEGNDYHLQDGYSRIEAIKQIGEDKVLQALAKANDVDLSSLPCIVHQGDERSKLMVPIISNNLKEKLDPVDTAHQLNILISSGEDVKNLEELFGKTQFNLLLNVLALPEEVQKMIKEEKIEASTAVKWAKTIKDEKKLIKQLTKAEEKVEQLLEAGKRKNKKVTDKVITGKRVATPIAAMRHLTPKVAAIKEPWAKQLLNFLNGMQAGLDPDDLFDKLLAGETIPAPPEKKRGRKAKATKAAPAKKEADKKEGDEKK